jgi:hypothetical protein
MKKLLLSILVMSALVLSVVPGVFAATTLGSNLGITINTEDFAPRVWQCDNRVVYDDGTEPGRISQDGTELVERINDYAFEGEQIRWKVLVLDKNGIEKVGDVFVIVNDEIQANCRLNHVLSSTESIDPACNARIDEEKLLTPKYDNVAAYYDCLLTVETPASMYGPSDITVKVTDIDGESGTMDEMEHWYLNPEISLAINADEEQGIVFDEVRPGTSSYSNMVTVMNDADDGSGVMLDMFISGTDFYDLANSGAKCGTSNQLKLENFAYHAVNGAYATKLGVTANTDAEGYRSIQYGIGFNDPNPFYNANEILPAQQVGPYYTANVLAPGAEMSLTFRLNLPEPCNGDFNSGDIYFWGEAI